MRVVLASREEYGTARRFARSLAARTHQVVLLDAGEGDDTPPRRARRATAAAIAHHEPDLLLIFVGDETTFPWVRQLVQAARDIPNAIYIERADGVGVLAVRRLQTNAVIAATDEIAALATAEGWDPPVVSEAPEGEQLEGELRAIIDAAHA